MGLRLKYQAATFWAHVIYENFIIILSLFRPSPFKVFQRLYDTVPRKILPIYQTKILPNHCLMSCLLASAIGMPFSCHYTLQYATCQIAKSRFTG